MSSIAAYANCLLGDQFPDRSYQGPESGIGGMGLSEFIIVRLTISWFLRHDSTTAMELVHTLMELSIV